jgi:hypothetical protein
MYADYKIHVATHCRVVAAKKCAKTTGQTAADVITVYQFNYAALPGKFGTLTTTAKGVVPVPEVSKMLLESDCELGSGSGKCSIQGPAAPSDAS